MGTNYLSFLQPAQAAGDIEINLRSIDGATEVDLTIPTTLAESDSPKATARKVEQALKAYFTDNNDPETDLPYAYSGQPVFSSTAPPSTFRVHRTEHILSIWSQCNWELSVETDSPTKTYAYAGPTPVFVTFSDAEELLSSAMSIDLTGSDGECVSPLQLQFLLALASGQICSTINNKVVASTYLVEQAMRLGSAIRGRVRPGLSYDYPVFRRPRQGNLGTTSSSVGFHTWNWVSSRAELHLIEADYLFETGDPTDLNNECKWTYVGGYYSIPIEIKGAVGSAIEIVTEGLSTTEIQLGSYREKFSSKGTVDYIKEALQRYTL